MNLTSLRNAVKRYGFDDSDPLDEWINAAMFDISGATDWPWLEDYLPNILTSAGSELISLPANLGKIISLRDRTNKAKIDYTGRKAFEMDIEDPTSGGIPESYTLVGSNALQLYPVPDGAYTVDLYYQKEIPSLSDGADVPDIPERAHYTIVLGAVRYGLMAESEEERAKEAESLYNDSLGRLMTYYGMRELDEPAQVRDTAGYGSEEA